MKDEDWKLIDNFIQDLWLIYKGLTSENFKMNVEKKLIQYCDNDNTIRMLMSIAENDLKQYI